MRRVQPAARPGEGGRRGADLRAAAGGPGDRRHPRRGDGDQGDPRRGEGEARRVNPLGRSVVQPVSRPGGPMFPLSLLPWSSSRPVKLRRTIEYHLGCGAAEAQTVAHEIKPIERVNLQRVIDRWAAASDPPAEPHRATPRPATSSDEGIVRYLITDELIRLGGRAAPARLRAGRDARLPEARPVPLPARRAPRWWWRSGRGRYSSELPVLEVMAGSREAARDALSALLDEAQKENVYKGRTISLERGESYREGVGHPVPRAAADAAGGHRPAGRADPRWSSGTCWGCCGTARRCGRPAGGCGTGCCSTARRGPARR